MTLEQVRKAAIIMLGVIFLAWAVRLAFAPKIATINFLWFDIATLIVGGSYIVASAFHHGVS